MTKLAKALHLSVLITAILGLLGDILNIFELPKLYRAVAYLICGLSPLIFYAVEWRKNNQN